MECLCAHSVTTKPSVLFAASVVVVVVVGIAVAAIVAIADETEPNEFAHF